MNQKYVNVSLFEISYKKKLTFSWYSIFLDAPVYIVYLFHCVFVWTHVDAQTLTSSLDDVTLVELLVVFRRFGAFPLHGTVRFGTARYGTVRLSSGRFAFPPQFSTAIEWAGLFPRRYSWAASTAVTSS